MRTKQEIDNTQSTYVLNLYYGFINYYIIVEEEETEKEAKRMQTGSHQSRGRRACSQDPSH